jgi:hypothetical protein
LKVIIAGGRDLFNGYGPIVAKAVKDSGFAITEIVCGCAPGIDRLGANYGDINGIPVTHFQANWAKFGDKAGPIRNEEMAKYGDALILIWNGKTPGSRSMKNNALMYSRPIFEVIV